MLTWECNYRHAAILYQGLVSHMLPTVIMAITESTKMARTGSKKPMITFIQGSKSKYKKQRERDSPYVKILT